MTIYDIWIFILYSWSPVRWDIMQTSYILAWNDFACHFKTKMIWISCIATVSHTCLLLTLLAFPFQLLSSSMSKKASREIPEEFVEDPCYRCRETQASSHPRAVQR